MDNGQGCILGGDKATDLGHHLQHSQSLDVCAFPAHVASRYDLKRILIRDIIVVWNKVGDALRRSTSAISVLIHRLGVMTHRYDKMSYTERVIVNVPSIPTYLFDNRMSGRGHSDRRCHVWSTVVTDTYQVGEARQHIKVAYGLTKSSEMGYLRTEFFDETLDNLFTLNKHFATCVGDSGVQLI